MSANHYCVLCILEKAAYLSSTNFKVQHCSVSVLILNQILSPDKSTDTDYAEGKSRVYCRGPRRGAWGLSTAPKLPSGKHFKGQVRSKKVGYVISLCTTLQLSEQDGVTQWSFLGISRGSGRYILWHQVVNFFNLLGSLASTEQLRKCIRILLSRYFQKILSRSLLEGPLTCSVGAMWLVILRKRENF